MGRLRPLIWKAWKQRMRSPWLAALDLGGPIVIAIVYLVIKSNWGLKGADENLDRDIRTNQLVPSEDLRRYICNQVLFASSGGPSQGERYRKQIENECGLRLVDVPSREAIATRLREALERRIAYRGRGGDLNRPSSGFGCQTLAEANATHQVGIFLGRERPSGGLEEVELFMTDAAQSQIVYQPYTLNSAYDELKFAQSDFNSGLHLLEACLTAALAGPSIKWQLRTFPDPSASVVLPLLSMTFQLAAGFCNALAVVVRIADEVETGLHRYLRSLGISAINYWTSQMIMVILQATIQCLIMATIWSLPVATNQLDPIIDTHITMRWLLLLTYTIASCTEAIFLAFLFRSTARGILLASMLAAIYTMWPFLWVIRYTPYEVLVLRAFSSLSLLNPASNYEALTIMVMAIRMQTGAPADFSSLSMGIVGGGLTADWTFGQLWALLWAQTLAWFLFTVLLDIVLQSPAGAARHKLGPMLDELVACCRCCLCAVLCPLGGRCASGGAHEASDEGEPATTIEALRTKSSGAKSAASKSAASAHSSPNPNRICCSLRHVTVSGGSAMVAHTLGHDPLRVLSKQLDELRHAEGAGRAHNKTTSQFLIKRSSPVAGAATPAPAPAPPSNELHEQPILLDEAIRQHIVWRKTSVCLERLCLDFRFNQITFLVGEPNLKDLLFDTLLGFRSLASGRILLDGRPLVGAQMGGMRAHLGYLGERDVYLQELSVLENVQFFGALRSSAGMDRWGDSESLFILNLMGLLQQRDKTPGSLTSRVSRELALAVACVGGHTKLLLLVEPTMNLRWKQRCKVLNLLKKFKAIRSIVVDTSDIDEAAAFGDRLVLFRSGHATLQGSPGRLTDKLHCGHWLVFEPVALEQAGKSAAGGRPLALAKLEQLTSELFRQDKLAALETSTRSVYDELMESIAAEEEAEQREQAGARESSPADRKRRNHHHQHHHRTIVILKVRHSPQAYAPLAKLMRTFESGAEPRHFRLAEINNESLEDALVLRMARAIYPNLPPDLLLSLQHRTTSQAAAMNRDSVASSGSGSGQVSVHQVLAPERQHQQEPRAPNMASVSMLRGRLRELLVDRTRAHPWELVWTLVMAALAPLLLFYLSLYSLQLSMAPDARELATAAASSPDRLLHSRTLDHSLMEGVYARRMALYRTGARPNAAPDPLEPGWPGGLALEGWAPDGVLASARALNAFLRQRQAASQELLTSLVLVDAQTLAGGSSSGDEATLVLDPYQSRALLAATETYARWLAASRQKERAHNTSANATTSAPALPPKFALHTFRAPWQEMVHGFMGRRLMYGLGLALAEGLATATLVLAPIRHRCEARVVRFRLIYWLAMALIDLAWWLLPMLGYLGLMWLVDGVQSAGALLLAGLVLLVYKLTSMPIAYLVSLVIDSRAQGFLFVLFFYVCFGYTFAIQLTTMNELAQAAQGIQYIVTLWLLQLAPICSLTNALANIAYVERASSLCKLVPAFLATPNTVPALFHAASNATPSEPTEFENRSIIDGLMAKVADCLAQGKQGISTNVLHANDRFGIMWQLTLMLTIGSLLWMFLVFSDYVYGLVALRANAPRLDSERTRSDPLGSIVRGASLQQRAPGASHLFRWDQERDRLVSDYVRCLADAQYVKRMAHNCVYVRIWLRPMGDQSSWPKRLAALLAPLQALGQPRNETSVELKTTLQVFIRLGNEYARYKVDRVKLLESYRTFIEDQRALVTKFALVDWTRDTLYKILLHGHYNTKAMVA